MSWTNIAVERGSYRFPNLCPDCLSPSPTSTLLISSDREKPRGYYVVAAKYEYLRVSVPFCFSCAHRFSNRSKLGQRLVLAAILAGVIAAVVLRLGSGATFLLAVCLGAPGIWMMGYRGWVLRVADYDERRIIFSIKHPTYAELFRAVNGTSEVV